MPDSNPPPDLLRRASRIGLRTLRQRPQAVGQTRDGDHVFEVRSVRLLLGSTSNHFNLSVPCSECGREVPGPAVLSRTDLDIAVPPALCPACAERARAAASGSTSSPRARGPVTAPLASDRGVFSGVGWRDVINQPLEPAMARPQEPAPAEVDAHGTNLSGLVASAGTSRAALQQVMASQQELIRSRDETNRRLADLAATPPPVPDTTGVDDLQQQLKAMRSEVVKALGVLTSSSEATAKRVAALEREVPKTANQLARVVDGQKAAVAGLAESMTADRSASQGHVARVRDEVGRLQETLAEALAETRREVTVRERELKVAVSDIRATVAALKSDLETSTQGQLDRLAAEIQRHATLAASVDTLATAVQVGERRTNALEQRVEDAVALLSERLDDQRDELAKALERELLRIELGLGPSAAQGAAAPERAGNGRPAGSLLDSLDDQLRAVEERLADLATKGPS